MASWQQRKDAWVWLRQTFPLAFPNKTPVPLAIGIYDAMVALNHDEMPAIASLKLALRYYVNSPHYLRQMIAGAARVDLNGNIMGEVSEEQAAHARLRLKTYRQKKPTLKKVTDEIASPVPADSPLGRLKLTLKKEST